MHFHQFLYHVNGITGSEVTPRIALSSRTLHHTDLAAQGRGSSSERASNNQELVGFCARLHADDSLSLFHTRTSAYSSYSEEEVVRCKLYTEEAVDHAQRIPRIQSGYLKHGFNVTIFTCSQSGLSYLRERPNFFTKAFWRHMSHKHMFHREKENILHRF